MNKVLNYLWLGLRFPAADEPYVQPLPQEYADNMLETAARNADTQIVLWIDSLRHSDTQADYFKGLIKNAPQNIELRDLRTLEAYCEEPLYNKPETNDKWRTNKQTIIWQQVDCAKILIALATSTNGTESYFTDFDIKNVDLNLRSIQSKMKKHGLVLGGSPSFCVNFIENQFFGFRFQHKALFQKVYEMCLQKCNETDDNPYYTYCFILTDSMHGRIREVTVPSRYIGVKAYHPTLADSAPSP